MAPIFQEHGPAPRSDTLHSALLLCCLGWEVPVPLSLYLVSGWSGQEAVCPQMDNSVDLEHVHKDFPSLSSLVK